MLPADVIADLDDGAPSAQERIEGEVTLFVRANTNPHKMAGALCRFLGAGQAVAARAIGAGAINQAVKGCAIARQMYLGHGEDLLIGLAFETLRVQGNERTAMVLNAVVIPAPAPAA